MDGNSIAIILVAIVGAIATIVSNIFVSNKQSSEMDAKLDKNQGIIEERIPVDPLIVAAALSRLEEVNKKVNGLEVTE